MESLINIGNNWAIDTLDEHVFPKNPRVNYRLLGMPLSVEQIQSLGVQGFHEHTPPAQLARALAACVHVCKSRNDMKQCIYMYYTVSKQFFFLYYMYFHCFNM